MKLAEAKARLTVHDLWPHFRLEGIPSKSCRCPFHEDRSASFSITADGALWNCFAGCGGGDAVDFYQHASGLLWFGAWKDSPAWIVTDGERVNAQARRMDGQPWPGIKAKAQTLPGSRAAWPIGARESLALPCVLLCEGGTDLLSAHHWIHAHQREVDVAAVAMLGASNSIHADALPLFAGKRIRIMAHTDEAGHAAAIRWKAQLDSVGARVDAADFAGLLMADGTPAKDLNDLTRIDPKQTHELQDLIPR